MNVHNKFSFAGLITNAVCCLVLVIAVLNNANAAPCFDNPQRAYEYLLAQEKSATQARDQKMININRASEGELVSLHGIGSSKAQAIILYREMFGDFKTVNELARVKGIGVKTIENNQGRLSVQDR
ncbi:ComEA family DNA-binding protein [Psychrobacter aquaticus]|uniref:ComEA family DNA-binding protein n=1 Tax=Psychrobacter aquaticus TaxID=248452 RepID=UPI00058BFBD7|nr:ComEA family DNA-binding protein [Psychrobacter aquaticus]